MRENAASLIHRLVISLWVLELAIHPMLAVAEIGFSYRFLSNYYLRFFYITVIALAILFHLTLRVRPVLPWVSLAMLVALFVGGAKGIAQGTVNGAYASHVFYTLMPVIMLSYGYHFFIAYQQDAGLRNFLKITMTAALALGAIAIGVFLYAYSSGFASYNAIGLWNAFLAGPFLINQPYAAFSATLATFVIVLAEKRSLIIGFLAFGLVGLAMNNRKLIWLSMFPLAAALLQANTIADFLINKLVDYGMLSGGHHYLFVPQRMQSMLEDISVGDFETASSARLSEAQAALAHLTSRLDHLLIGAGFGARYQPWEASPDYLVHYVHFTPLSYVWIGGIALSLAVYGFLLSLGATLVLRARKREFDGEYIFVIYWLWGIVVLSTMGAVLMNNTWLWLIIGAALSMAGTKTARTGVIRSRIPMTSGHSFRFDPVTDSGVSDHLWNRP